MGTKNTDGDDPDEGGANGGYRAVLERYDNAPDQCTIFPAELEPEDRMARWITAESPGFIDLWEHR